MEEQTLWNVVLRRDPRWDGRFVYGVRSTGIYCRPSCPARRPRREHVEFFSSTDRAEKAGYRACRRCRPDGRVGDDPHRELVARICRHIANSDDGTPSLAQLSREFAMSPYHLQRTFKRIVGITPKQFADSRRLERFKERLREGTSVTEALYEAGYSSSSSLYEGASGRLGMTPTQYRQKGRAVSISYTVASTPLGQLLVAATSKGICALRWGDSDRELEESLAREFSEAVLRRNDGQFASWISTIKNHLLGLQPELELPLDVRATAFQRRVWDALRAIPYGSTRSYGAVAASLGKPGAARAVARACASNPAALLIPCHRVVREDGRMGGYRWGVKRKRELLARESEADAEREE